VIDSVAFVYCHTPDIRLIDPVNGGQASLDLSFAGDQLTVANPRS